MSDRKLNTNRVLGIDISDRSIEACELSIEGKDIKIEAISRVKLDIGIIKDGIVQKPEILQKYLQLILRGAQPVQFKTKRVVFSLSELAVFSFAEELPLGFDQDKIDQLIISKVENLHIKGAGQFYKLTENIPNEKTLRLTCSLTDKENLDNLLRQVKLAGFEVIGVEAESESMARSVIKEFGPDEGVVFVDIGTSNTIISVFDSQGLSLSKTISVAGEAITKEISQSLKVSTQKAEEIKITYGLGQSKYLDKFSTPVLELLDKIIQEIKDSIKHYKTLTDREVSKIRLYGGTSQMKLLQEFFIERIPGYEVSKADTWLSDNNNEIEQGILYLGAIGLALKGFDYNGSLKKENFITAVNESNTIQNTSPDSSLKMPETIITEQPQMKKRQIQVQTDKREKKRGNNKHKSKIISNFKEKLPKIKKSNVYYVLLLLAVLGMLGFAAFRIFIVNKADLQQNEAGADRESISLSETVVLNLAEVEGNDLNFQEIQKDIKREQDFSATGTGKSSGKVKGVVEIINDSTVTYNFVKNTRIMTDNNKLYYLDDTVSSPANGKVDISVTAASEGEGFELESGVNLAFPGLSEELQEEIYAETKEGFKLLEEAVVTKEDIENAAIQIGLIVDEISLSDFDIESEEGLVMLNDLLKIEIIGIEFNVKEGDLIDTFKGVASIEGYTLEFEEDELLQFMSQRFTDYLTAGEKADNYRIENVEIILKSYNNTDNSVEVTVSGDAVVKK